MYPDWESTQQYFGSQARAQSTESHQPGLNSNKSLLLKIIFIAPLLRSPTQLGKISLSLRRVNSTLWSGPHESPEGHRPPPGGRPWGVFMSHGGWLALEERERKEGTGGIGWGAGARLGGKGLCPGPMPLPDTSWQPWKGQRTGTLDPCPGPGDNRTTRKPIGLSHPQPDPLQESLSIFLKQSSGQRPVRTGEAE